MGTRYEDQPPEQWAEAESLDPTPVWKQYVLIALLLFVGLIAVVVVALLSIAPQLATPPALVPGDRLVLSATDVPPVGGAKLIPASLTGPDRELWLTQPARGEVYAFRRAWSFDPSAGATCHIEWMGRAVVDQRSFIGRCPDGHAPTFGGRGQSFEGPAMRGLDQYLVSVSEDRVIVNLSRLIRAEQRTGAPVPTGIPQPQQP